MGCNKIVTNIEASPIKAAIESFHLQLKIIHYLLVLHKPLDKQFYTFIRSSQERSLIYLPPITHVSTLSTVVLEEVVKGSGVIHRVSWEDFNSPTWNT